jgi:hypothetical protein
MRLKTFYDREHNPFQVKEVLFIGKAFSIARIFQTGDDIVGLFSEDDDNCFLQSTFSSYWLEDLANVASMAKTIVDIQLQREL